MVPTPTPHDGDDKPAHKLSADLPDIESILSLNPRKKEVAHMLPTAGKSFKLYHFNYKNQK